MLTKCCSNIIVMSRIATPLSALLKGGACPKSNPSVSSTPARIAQKDDCTLRSGLFGQPGGGEVRSGGRRA